MTNSEIIILKDVADIRTGVYARPHNQGEVTYLQSNNFNEEGELTKIHPPELPLSDISEKHLLKTGDILFSAKGSRNFAFLFNSKTGLSVASSTFFVIKIKKEYEQKIMPAYLSWYLNHPKTKELLQLKARGSKMPSISKGDLQELEIRVPAVELQQKIIKIDELRKSQNKLLNQIKEFKDNYTQNIVFNKLNKI